MSTDLNPISPLLQQLGIYDMPAHQRLELAQQIIASVIADVPQPLTDAQLEELDRRIADDDANPDDVIPGEEVFREAKARVATLRS